MHPWRAIIWAITSVLVAAVAYSAAITTTLLIERSLSVPQVESLARAPRGERAGRGESGRDRRRFSEYKAILEQNIFAARRAPETPRAAPPAVTSAKPAEPPPPFTVTVTGTLLAGDESFAMVIGPGGEQVYRIGECLPEADGERTSKCRPDQAKLIQVEMSRIVVDKGGKRIPIDISSGPAAASAKRPERDKGDRTAREPLSPAERRQERLAARSAVAERGGPLRRILPQRQDKEEAEEQQPDNLFPIEQDGDTFHVTVPNAEVEKAFENFSEVAGQAAAVPIIENGEPKGFQLRKIRPGSIFQRLGLRDNDLVLSVNGESLTTADQALRLFTVFRNEREITLDIQRGGEDIHMNYIVE